LFSPLPFLAADTNLTTVIARRSPGNPGRQARR
jgi:hypothetical protein